MGSKKNLGAENGDKCFDICGMLCNTIYFSLKQASLLKVINSREYFSH